MFFAARHPVFFIPRGEGVTVFPKKRHLFSVALFYKIMENLERARLKALSREFKLWRKEGKRSNLFNLEKPFRSARNVRSIIRSSRGGSRPNRNLRSSAIPIMDLVSNREIIDLTGNFLTHLQIHEKDSSRAIRFKKICKLI